MAKIKSGQPVNQGKLIKATNVSEPNPEQSPPIFDLSRMRKGYDLNECNAEEKAAFADTLFRLSQLTWSEFKHAPKRGLGSEKISKESITGDSTEFLKEDAMLLAFRFSDMKPMVGYRGEDGKIFHIIWLDTKFKIYKH